MASLISVVVPTIKEREGEMRDRCIRTYEEHTENLELIVIENDGRPCGVAWQEGADKATGDYLHFTADDIDAMPNWWQAAVAACDQGDIPAPLIFYGDGKVQSCGSQWEEVRPDGEITGMTRVPFCSMKQWERIGPMLTDIHYYTDNWFSHRAKLAGMNIVIAKRYRLIHYLTAAGRGSFKENEDYVQYLAHGGSF